ncbi:MAG: hypothetical protein QHJ81_03670 [Anaerolineae bacterium]|nr:hypothetical protein [Anaerolineae bacterium]
MDAELQAGTSGLSLAALTPEVADAVFRSELRYIAPLHRLVPWREAEKMWEELEQGKYEWSAMSRWVRGVSHG